MNKKITKKIFKFLVVFWIFLGLSFTNIPFYALSGLLDSFVKTRNIVDKGWHLSQNSNVVDKFTSYRNLVEKFKIYEAQAATLQYVGGATGTGTGATYSVALNSLTGGIGSAAQAGDLVIVVTGWASAANGDPGVSTPTGYTEVYDMYKSDTRDVNFSANWKIMGGTPDTSVTVRGFNNAANGGATAVHVWRGADQTTPMDVTPPVGVSAGNLAHPNSPSITPVTSGAYVLTVGMGTGDTTPLTQTVPTNYGNAKSVAGTGSTMSIIADIASKAWSSGAEDPAVWTGGDVDSNSDSWAAGTLAIRPAPPAAQTTISNFVSGEPGNSTIAPAASGNVDSFGLATNSGTDTVSAATVGLAAGMGTYIQTVAITNDAGGTTYCSAAPSGDSASLSTCGIPVSTTNTQFKIKLTAKAHTSMPAPDGGLYNVTATITGFTSGNSQAGTDSGSSTLTIDNDSPAGTTGANATSGESTQSTVSWTAPGDADYQQVYIYCKTASMVIGEAPTEGTDPTVDPANCDGTARMKYKGTASPQIITGLTNGTPYYFRIYARDTNGNFTAYSATQEVSGTPSAPAATLTISASTGAKVTALNSGDTSKFVHNTSCTTDGTCAAFKLAASGGAVSVTQIKVTEFGTVDAYNNFANPALIYDTDANYSNGTAGTFGSVANFAADQTITFTNAGLSIPNASTYYFYIRFDLANGANYPVGGNGIDFKINASSDVVSDGTESGTATLVSAASSCSVTSETCVRPNVTSITYPITSPLNGARIGQSITINGAGFGTTCDGTNNRVTIGGAGNVVSCTGTTFSNTSISITNFQYSSGDSYGGTTSLLARIGGIDDDVSQDMYVYPDITDVTNPTVYPNAAREYSASDSDGVITINGNHFGTAQGSGYVMVLGQTATVNSWGENAIQIRIPTTIGDGDGGAADYQGNIIVYQGTGGNSSASDTYGGGTYRILPRIISTGPVNLKGGRGDTGVSITGDHLCQDASCVGSPEGTEDITFNGVTGKSGSTWGHTSITTITIPATATDGNLILTSDGDAAGTFTSNALSYDIKFKPTVSDTGRDPANTSTVASKNPVLTGSAFSDPNDSPADSFIDSQWEVDQEGTFATPEWTDTKTNVTSVTVNTTDGAFGGLRAGQTDLACGTTYSWRFKYKDNSGVTSQEWSDWSNTWTFTTPSCGPDATSITNNDEPALTDGGRITQSIIINGSGFGNVSDGNQVNCAGGASTGCVKIGGTGGQIIADANISSWTDTAIAIVLTSADLTTTYGGATTNGLIVYAAGISDANGQTFYVYPDITSLSVTEAREGDTFTINGNKFGTGSSGGNVSILGVAATTGTWTETSISATVPDGINDATDSGYVIITQGTGSNNKPTNSTDAQASLAMLPRITSLTTPADAPDNFSAWQGSSITVNGSHFGSYGAANSRVSVNGSTVDPGAGNWGVSAITVTVPSAATNNGSIQATRTDTKTSNSYSTFYVLPKITSTGPTTGEAGEGDAITIAGNHFCGSGGACTNLPTVRFYNTGQTVDVTANSGGTNTSLAVTVSSSISDSINTYNLEIVRSSAGGQDDGKSSTNTTRNNFSYTILPDITDTTNPVSPYTNAAREYSASDSDGIITVNGKHFGTAGTVTVLGQTATQQTTATCSGSAYQNICVGIRIPESIGDGAGGASDYLGNIILTRTAGPADSKTDTYGGGNYRILPRILSFNPTTPAIGENVEIIGNHLCQNNGTCPSVLDTNNKVTFTSVDAAILNTWVNGNSSTVGVNVVVPSGAPNPSNVTVKSNDYNSNTLSLNLVSNTPSDPLESNLGQFKDAGYSQSITTGKGINSTSVYLRIIDMQASVPDGTLYPQVEVQPIGTVFTGTYTAEGAGWAGPGPTTGTTTVSALTTNTKYHWQARVRHNKSELNYYSNWVSFGGNTDPNDVDFYIDTVAPTLGSCPFHSSITAGGATVSWTPNDSGWSTTFTKQIQYSTSTGFTYSNCTIGSNIETCGTPTSGYTSGSQQVIVSSLSPNTIYYYKIRSKDEAGNEAIVGDTSCTFTTSKAETRTTEFYITTKTGVLAGGSTYSPTFTVYIPEDDYVVQSAFVEFSGIFDADSNTTASSTVWVNSQSGVDYTINTATSVNTSFSIIHKVPAGDLNIATPTNPNNTNTLNVAVASGDPSISIAAAKIVVTYYHKPVQ